MISREKCLELLRKHNPDNIVRHSIQVNKVAVFLANKINKNGIDVDIEAVDIASLLHDLGKYKEVTTGIDHGLAAERILMEEGFPKKIRELVKSHLKKNVEEFDSMEEKIIFYADGRVSHDKIVTLDERTEELKKRLPHYVEILVRNKPVYKTVEKELLGRIKTGMNMDWDKLEKI